MERIASWRRRAGARYLEYFGSEAAAMAVLRKFMSAGDLRIYINVRGVI